MKNKIAALIKKSLAIKPDEKPAFLQLVNFLNDEQLIKLRALLEVEQDGFKEIDASRRRKISEENQNTIDEIGALLKKGEKEFMSFDEVKDEVKAEQLLEKLDDIIDE